eukprot:CAMPEP_0195517008 /NCGR_PEP_ID=MMETSP0794_2-20130614/9505_1 /TAXON_ID=515487 /ORGANISM="Stephanopyxis turris, Strain CCMP 815" /LENGTH=668 /DNA_ID=CAMNT_0040645737 /DNA_START=157 /DNA_END=2163 /DNA_ORIENTATION=-
MTGVPTDEKPLIQVKMLKIPSDAAEEIEGNTRAEARRLAGLMPHYFTHMGFGTHYIDLFVGNPAQEQTLALSTSSHYSAFPCKGCEECGEKQDEFFDQFESPGFKFLDCDNCSPQGRCIDNFDVCEAKDVYLDGTSSWTAFEAQDVVYIGGEPHGRPAKGTNFASIYGFPLIFGCQTASKGYFATNVADGIMGMSPLQTSFVNQMYRSGNLPNPAFSLCFNPGLSEGQSDTSKEVDSGSVTFGGTDTGLHDTPMVYAKNVRADRSYALHVSKIYVRGGGGESVQPWRVNQKIVPVYTDYDAFNARGAGVILDSGTPYTSLDKSMNEPFKQAWMSVTGSEYHTGRVMLTANQLKNLPTIIFQLKAFDDTLDVDANSIIGLAGELDPSAPLDVLFAVPALHYMELNPSTGYYRSKLFFDHPEGSTLGANTMQGHDIHFDLRNKRLGFAEVFDCVKPLSDGHDNDNGNGNNGDEHDDDGVSKKNSLGGDGWGRGTPWGGFGDVGNGNGYGYGDDDFSRKFDPNGDGSRNGMGGDDDGSGINRNGMCTSARCRAFVGSSYALILVTGISVYLAFKNTRKQRAAEADYMHAKFDPDIDQDELPRQEPNEDFYAPQVGGYVAGPQGGYDGPQGDEPKHEVPQGARNDNYISGGVPMQRPRKFSEVSGSIRGSMV